MDITENVLGEEKELEMIYGFDFKAKFKIIDTREGFHLIFTYLFKRGLTKEEITFLENVFFKKT